MELLSCTAHLKYSSIRKYYILLLCIYIILCFINNVSLLFIIINVSLIYITLSWLKHFKFHLLSNSDLMQFLKNKSKIFFSSNQFFFKLKAESVYFTGFNMSRYVHKESQLFCSQFSSIISVRFMNSCCRSHWKCLCVTRPK